MAHHRRRHSCLHRFQPATVDCMRAVRRCRTQHCLYCWRICMHCMPRVWSFSVPCCRHACRAHCAASHIGHRSGATVLRAPRMVLRTALPATPCAAAGTCASRFCFQCDATEHTCVKGKNGERCNTPGTAGQRPQVARVVSVHLERPRGMYITQASRSNGAPGAIVLHTVRHVPPSHR